MKSRGDVFVNARQVPVTEKFADVRQLVTEPRQVDAYFAQLAQDAGASANGTRAQVAISALERIVQDSIVGLQFGQLQIRQFHHVERFIEILRLIDQQCRVPINDDDVMLVIAQETASGF